MPAERRASYRVQLHAGFGFDAGSAIVDYLQRLGISHLYCSPSLQAAPGSTHGYDVVDYTRVSQELGGPDGHDRLHRALEVAGMGQLLDIVPNHMAITGRENAWWWDVLENGPASIYADYFDVDWDSPETRARNRVLLPILADHYGRVLEAGEVRLWRDGGGLVVAYQDHEMPIAPRSLGAFLLPAVDRMSEADPARIELESVAAAFAHLPPSWFTDRESVRERHRDKEVLRHRLAVLCDEEPTVAEAVRLEVEAVNADPDRLDELLERQNFRLAWWRAAGDELDYRRFFDITTLIGLRQEDERVFRDSHRLILEWLGSGVIDGVRVDHVDGLRDPHGYLAALAECAPRSWTVVEKILQRDEPVPDDWPIAGTTGYDWLNVVGGVLVDPAGEQELSEAYAKFSGLTTPWADIAYQAKLEIIRGPLATDVRRITAILMTVCEEERRFRDYTRRELRDLLEALLASFGGYRTYVRPGRRTSQDVAAMDQAVASARARRPDLDSDLVEFVRAVLLLEAGHEAGVDLALRFQQVSSAVMAKGVEDTAFYRYVRLVSLNEVGGDPYRFGTSPDELHRFAAQAQVDRPWGLLATSTHDTKRSEDVRARLAVLSEIPGEWAAAVDGWSAMAVGHKRAGWPDANLEWLWYQSLVGAWPLTVERATVFMEKAAKEAKVHTSWTNPVAEYDDAVQAFVAGFMGDHNLMGSVGSFVERILRPGWINALSQKLLTLTAPGVPDVYQGSELWDLALVDPDNRRPVDFDARRRLLDDLHPDQWRTDPAAGGPKLAVVARALSVRSRFPACFGAGGQGRYEPMVASGAAASHVVAFMRGGRAITIVPRLPVGLSEAGGWRNTTIELPGGDWTDQFTGTVLSGHTVMERLLDRLPVALLVRS